MIFPIPPEGLVAGSTALSALSLTGTDGLGQSATSTSFASPYHEVKPNLQPVLKCVPRASVLGLLATAIVATAVWLAARTTPQTSLAAALMLRRTLALSPALSLAWQARQSRQSQRDNTSNARQPHDQPDHIPATTTVARHWKNEFPRQPRK